MGVYSIYVPFLVSVPDDSLSVCVSDYNEKCIFIFNTVLIYDLSISFLSDFFK